MSAPMTVEQDTGRELAWRAFRPEDAGAAADLMAAAEAVDKTGENYDADDIIEELVNDLIDLEADTRVVWEGEQMVAMGHVFGWATVNEVHGIWCQGCVRPTHRRRGIGAQLLRWQLQRGEQLHAATHPRVPAHVKVGVAENNSGLEALVRAEGLEPIRSWFEMGRDLHGDLPGPQPMPGIRLAPFDPDLDDEVRRAHNIAFRDHFGSTERTPEEWRQYFTGTRAFRPDLSLLALADGSGTGEGHADVAGFLLGYIYDADVAAKGRREVLLGQLGTLPAYRGRGIGSALLARALADWAAAGHEYACLGVDTANGTGALGLYERAGLRVVKTSTSWARRIPAAAS